MFPSRKAFNVFNKRLRELAIIDPKERRGIFTSALNMFKNRGDKNE